MGRDGRGLGFGREPAALANADLAAAYPAATIEYDDGKRIRSIVGWRYLVIDRKTPLKRLEAPAAIKTHE